MSCRIHVAILLRSVQLGGAERQALLLGKLLSKCAAVDVTFFILQEGKGRVPDELRTLGLRCIQVPAPSERRLHRFAASAFHLARALRRSHVDVLLPYTTTPNVIGGLVWRTAGCRTCIWSQRDGGSTATRLRWTFIERFAARATPHFVSNSSHGAEFLTRALGVCSEKINIIYNGVQPAEDPGSLSDQRLEGYDALSSLTAVFVANLQPRKDHATVLRGWRRLVADTKACAHPPQLLLLGRPGSTYHATWDLATELGIHGSVQFMGEVRDVRSVLRRANFAIHAGTDEGLCNAVLEEMLFGLPVVAVDIPGVSDAVSEANRRLLFPPGDITALFERLRLMRDKPTERHRIGEENRRRVKAEFSVDQLLAGSIAIINQGLELAGHRTRLEAPVQSSS